MTTEIRLQRFADVYGAMMGRLHIPGIVQPIFTLEDSWNNNQPRVSCIPAGVYNCVPHGWEDNTPVKFKRTWELKNVPGRSAILIHSGNTNADTEGCILLGLSMNLTNFPRPQATISQSVVAVDMLRKRFGANGFTIRVEGV